MDDTLDDIVALLLTLTNANKVMWRAYGTGAYRARVGDYDVWVTPGAGPNDTRVRVKSRRGRMLHQNTANHAALIAAITSPKTDGDALDAALAYMQTL